MEQPTKTLVLLSIICLIAIWFFGFYYAYDPPECWNYTNETGSTSRFGGNCYVNGHVCFSTNEKCGFLGISCYETKEPYMKCYKDSICYKIKDGSYC